MWLLVLMITRRLARLPFCQPAIHQRLVLIQKEPLYQLVIHQRLADHQPRIRQQRPRPPSSHHLFPLPRIALVLLPCPGLFGGEDVSDLSPMNQTSRDHSSPTNGALDLDIQWPAFRARHRESGEQGNLGHISYSDLTHGDDAFVLEGSFRGHGPSLWRGSCVSLFQDVFLLASPIE